MAPALEEREKEDDSESAASNIETNGASPRNTNEVDDEEEDEEEEPRLEYTSMTRKLTSVYRNGDATSSFLVAGDKMVSY